MTTYDLSWSILNNDLYYIGITTVHDSLDALFSIYPIIELYLDQLISLQHFRILRNDVPAV